MKILSRCAWFSLLVSVLFAVCVRLDFPNHQSRLLDQDRVLQLKDGRKLVYEEHGEGGKWSAFGGEQDAVREDYY